MLFPPFLSMKPIDNFPYKINNLRGQASYSVIFWSGNLTTASGDVPVQLREDITRPREGVILDCPEYH
jgi:hypothetical protein